MNSNAAQADALRWQKFPRARRWVRRAGGRDGRRSAVVQAARVSYGEGTRKVSDDRGLIRYLLRHQHTTPFEMAELKLLVRVPMDCWRQWIRHRTANVNEYSTRYSLAIDAAQTTRARRMAQPKPTTNRQGSGPPLDVDTGERLSAAEAEFQSRARQLYEERIAAGVAREQARKDLPLSTYTEAYWKVDLHNLLHFLALRMDAHAQFEIRSYAATIGERIVQPLVSAGLGSVRRLSPGGDDADATGARRDSPLVRTAINVGQSPGKRRRFFGGARRVLVEA